ncbi:DUF2231 domain-containing protein [uncultured Cellulomonas sp.]|uniref:DUF2231 domain-containing protein n=1 Tax=uncultured Cellulomonas sp. TaxID=189682 RepID=UPI0026143C85|nr:DUF2231 domain-containing protein [uncultured Cellulomonas sp.]
MAVHGTPDPTPTSRAGEPNPVMVDAVLRVEHAEALDPWVDRLAPAAAALVKDPTVRDLLHGKAMGHALHPLLTDVPIGTWSSAFLLDFIGGKRSRPAATRLIGTGILAAVPTAVTGLAEWAATSDQPARRVGLVHAASNTVGLGLYVMSYRARRRGRHGVGVLTSLAGLSVIGVSGFLGAHLSVARKVGTRDEAFVAQVPLGGDGAAEPGDFRVGGAGPAPDAATGGRHRDEGTDPTTAI